MKNHLFFLSLFIAVVLPGCIRPHQPVNSKLVEKINLRKNNPWNRQVVDSSVTLLKTGDIVLRRGNDITSYMLCQLNASNKTYSHCGIVLVENGYPFVYHSIGGEDNPDQELRRDSASVWLSAARNEEYGVVRLDMPDSNLVNLCSWTRYYYKLRKKFDMHFDINTDDRFYCAEFVYKTINKAMKDSAYIKPVTVMGYTFVGIDNLFLNRHARFICQIRFK